MIKVILHNGTLLKTSVIENSVDAFHEAIDCETFEGYSGTELGHAYGLDIFLDGNGKFNHEKKVTGVFIDNDLNVVDFIVGDVLICRHDDEGESISVNESVDLSLVRNALEHSSCLDIPKDFPYPVADWLLVLHC